jgi:5-methylcytosine-specific restriction enzyme subunit McrC
MEKLFERYVCQILKRQLTAGFEMQFQSRASWLAHHQGAGWFNLQPDMSIKKRGSGPLCVLDTKWKMLDSNASDRKRKYGISQADFYQLFAYAKQCLPEGGNLFLIYPMSENFLMPLPAFTFGDAHTLWVVPFDLENDSLILGDWAEHCDWHAMGRPHAA